MKKLTYTTAIFMAMVATSVFAHHPSADYNPNFDTVNDQLESTPHYDMDIYDMGATTAAGESDEATANQDSAGGVATARTATALQDGPREGAPAEAAGTIGLMEDVE